ncbi:3-hydroxyisobutyrate dehydrogenase [Nocardioides sp. GY 10113]|uniref:3-hydroxyisobutyrate dehydrogenase n=1 Tax=Nocardioides sp. GY 10113 TaxID=2569761 RepID=UPI0010A7BA06|nr:3-hydroxyisobutyrate dehydrogenase [Nocardioides sp. GY 10113]TIC85054.1 3-hydroxyisobutyrate dehydrogenase [Nocardioides sp. GY 10113]
MKIGFLGLGHMGGPMAANLVKAGHTVRGYDPVPASQETARAAGIDVVDSAAAAATDVDAVVSSLPNGAIVLAAYDEALPAAAPGTLFVDSSTIAVDDAHEAALRATKAGHRFVDAPVSGGVVGAEAGTLTFMVGASEADLEAVRPVLEPMAGRVVHCGEVTAGQVAKLCNNLILAVSMAGVSEALVVGERLGLSHQAFYDVVSTSSGSCWALNTNCPVPGPVPTSPANRDYQPGFATALMNKDLGLAMAAVEKTGTDAPVGTLVADLYRAFGEAGGSGLDFSAIIQQIRGESA